MEPFQRLTFTSERKYATRDTPQAHLHVVLQTIKQQIIDANGKWKLELILAPNPTPDTGTDRLQNEPVLESEEEDESFSEGEGSEGSESSEEEEESGDESGDEIGDLLADFRQNVAVDPLLPVFGAPIPDWMTPYMTQYSIQVPQSAKPSTPHRTESRKKSSRRGLSMTLPSQPPSPLKMTLNTQPVNQCQPQLRDHSLHQSASMAPFSDSVDEPFDEALTSFRHESNDEPQTIPPHPDYLSASAWDATMFPLAFNQEASEVIPVNETRPTRNHIAWTQEEDEALIEAHGRYGSKWVLISTLHLPGRSVKSIMSRYRLLVKDSAKKSGRWDPEEDAILKACVAEFGADQFTQVADSFNARSNLGQRTKNQIFNRWRRYLDPNIKMDPWTEEEDAIMLQAYEKYGTQFKSFMSLLPGRTNVQIRARAISLLKLPRKSENDEEVVYWDDNLDHVLRQTIFRFSTKGWKRIATEFVFENGFDDDSGYDDEACAKRWKNVLLHQMNLLPLTQEENQRLVEWVVSLNHDWNTIAARFPGRSAETMKLRYEQLVAMYPHLGPQTKFRVSKGRTNQIAPAREPDFIPLPLDTIPIPIEVVPPPIVPRRRGRPPFIREPGYVPTKRGKKPRKKTNPVE